MSPQKLKPQDLKITLSHHIYIINIYHIQFFSKTNLMFSHDYHISSACNETEGNLFLLWRNTVFKLTFDKSVNKRYSFGSKFRPCIFIHYSRKVIAKHWIFLLGKECLKIIPIVLKIEYTLLCHDEEESNFSPYEPKSSTSFYEIVSSTNCWDHLFFGSLVVA